MNKSLAKVGDIFYYDESSESGLRWKVENKTNNRNNKRYPHDIAGTKCFTKKGNPRCWQVMYDSVSYLVHRIVWYLHFGEIPEGLVIDHVNGNAFDNRISNLRLVPQSLNTKNAEKRHDNVSSATGVYFTTNGRGTEYCAASWYEDGKQKVKYFNIKHFGKEAAFLLAKQYRDEKILDKGYTERHGT